VIPNTGYEAVTLFMGSQFNPHGWNLLGLCRREASSFAALRSGILTIREFEFVRGALGTFDKREVLVEPDIGWGELVAACGLQLSRPLSP
jgi:hypothetical protein